MHEDHGRLLGRGRGGGGGRGGGDGGASWPIALLLVACGAVMGIAVLLTPQTRLRSLTETAGRASVPAGAVI
ncbi:hypothetical protein [Planobispora takensis]|uniref:Uncharacterized protein n=1 Tax=Planobispora takensis TaxID=1367882 RepID=A0A8J3WY03_9ACTN|nr:hypothetical protein [Planobispora takensis]GII05830.1 hypothetical protein Pta02_78380 [Planobispora takensis]